MAKTELLTRRMAISKANAQMVAIVAGAAFITVFCLVASQTLWSQNAYQARVTKAKETAHTQLLSNIQAYSDLAASYESFVSSPTNVLGGNSSGSGQNDGNNAVIILDALPPSYDFPALTSSIEKITSNDGLKLSNMTGTDDQLSQQNNSSSTNPTPVPMPFSFTVSSASYDQIGQLMTVLQKSIRPIQIDSIDLSGAANNMTLTVNAHTYFQPSKSVNVTEQVIK